MRPRLLSLLILLVGCSESQPAAQSTLERLRAEGVVRVGFANEAPFAYLDPQSGELVGEAPTIARRVFAQLGVERVEGVLTEFGSLIPGLLARRFDLIAAGMYVTPERCRQIAFSEPTYGIGEALLVRTGNPLGLHAYADLTAHPSARLGVVAGTVELGYARAEGIPAERTVIFPDAPSALEGVVAGRIAAYAGTRLTIDDLLAKIGTQSLERARPFSDPIIDGRPARGHGAFGLRSDDPELLAAINAELRDLIGSPEHLEWVRPFGFGAEDLPGAVTTAELCQP